MDWSAFFTGGWFWPPLMLFGAMFVVGGFFGRLPPHAQCPRCKYDLRHARRRDCPECGWQPRKLGDSTRRRRNRKLIVAGLVLFLGGVGIRLWQMPAAEWIQLSPDWIARRMARMDSLDNVRGALNTRIVRLAPGEPIKLPREAEVPEDFASQLQQFKADRVTNPPWEIKQSDPTEPVFAMNHYEYSKGPQSPYTYLTRWERRTEAGTDRPWFLAVSAAYSSRAGPGTMQELRVHGEPRIVELNGETAVDLTYVLKDVNAKYPGKIVFCARVTLSLVPTSLGQPLQVAWMLEPNDPSLVAPTMKVWTRWLTGWPK